MRYFLNYYKVRFEPLQTICGCNLLHAAKKILNSVRVVNNLTCRRTSSGKTVWNREVRPGTAVEILFSPISRSILRQNSCASSHLTSQSKKINSNALATRFGVDYIEARTHKCSSENFLWESSRQSNPNGRGERREFDGRRCSIMLHPLTSSTCQCVRVCVCW